MSELRWQAIGDDPQLPKLTARTAALASAIVQLLRDPWRAQALGDAAHARCVTAYSIQSVVRHIEGIYR